MKSILKGEKKYMQKLMPVAKACDLCHTSISWFLWEFFLPLQILRAEETFNFKNIFEVLKNILIAVILIVIFWFY